MKTTQASAKMFRSPAVVADPTPMPDSAILLTAAGGSDACRSLRPPWSSALDSSRPWGSQTGRPRTALGGASERRRLERDLHDGVQTELVALIVKLALAHDDPDTPPALADMLAEFENRAQFVLDLVRNIARGIYPPVLADFGLREALRGLAARGAADMRLVGTAPRSTDEAEEAVYFACSEAIQNVVKHAGAKSRVTLRLFDRHGSLVVRIADDGDGFDLDQAHQGAGVRNMRDRIEDLGGTFKLASKPGCGTVLTLSLPWPPPADRRP